jgi:hypothetical protein
LVPNRLQVGKEIPCALAKDIFCWRLKYLSLKMPKLESLPWAFDLLFNVERLYLDIPQVTTLQWTGSIEDCRLKGVTRLWLTSVRLVTMY